jgi:tetratricopeptide (TPR) repeat protein
LRVARKHLELNPDDARALYLGAIALMQLDEPETALKWAERAYAVDPSDPAVLYNLACVYAVGGRTEQAIDYLSQAVQNGFGHREWIDTDADLDSLRIQDVAAKYVAGAHISRIGEAQPDKPVLPLGPVALYFTTCRSPKARLRLDPYWRRTSANGTRASNLD